jgi:flagellar basal body rod protein FlgB
MKNTMITPEVMAIVCSPFYKTYKAQLERELKRLKQECKELQAQLDKTQARRLDKAPIANTDKPHKHP